MLVEEIHQVKITLSRIVLNITFSIRRVFLVLSIQNFSRMIIRRLLSSLAFLHEHLRRAVHFQFINQFLSQESKYLPLLTSSEMCFLRTNSTIFLKK